MFYPAFLPNGTNQLPPEDTLRAEAAVAQILVQGDRAFLAFPDVLERLAYELDNLALCPFDAATALLEANRDPLLRFIREEAEFAPRGERWRWLDPDWERVGEVLGEGAARRWRADLAQRVEEAAHAPAPA